MRAVADVVPDLLWRTDSTGRANWFNQRWREYTGLAAIDLVDAGWLQTVHPDDHDMVRSTWKHAVTEAKPFEFEHRLRAEGGDYRWFLLRAAPLCDDGGGVASWFAAATDIHDQRSAIQALQHSELRFRTLIEGMPQLVWRAVNNGDWTWASPQWCDYTGQTPSEARGWGWLEAFHVDDRPAAREAWGRARTIGAVEIEGRIRHAEEDRHRHFRTRALPVRDAEGRILEWLGTSTYVDDILQLQEQQAILVAELQHRTRNIMAVVRSLTTRTLKDSPSLEHFGLRIGDRLSALARVQGLLSRRETGTRVSFDRLLHEELSAHLDLSTNGTDERVQLDGPSGVPLRSATVQTLALALHELATNAIKYGALSDRGGRLDVRWGVAHEAPAEPYLWVDWLETGVSGLPPASAPAQGGGYGRELIERALPYQLGARTSYELTADGVHCTIQVDTVD